MLTVHRVTFTYLNEINLRAPLNTGRGLDSAVGLPADQYQIFSDGCWKVFSIHVRRACSAVCALESI